MGCDIHTYLEYANPPREGCEPYWQNFTTNGGSRNYLMFGVLAGVRYPEVKLFEPKGMPDGAIGYGTSGGYWTSVAPESHPDWADGDDWVSLNQAESWVKNGYSVGETDVNGRLRRVSGPDWHSHSWLTLEELRSAMGHYAAECTKKWPGEPSAPPSEWKATVAAMEAFAADGLLTRLVFWFDN